MKRRTSKLSRGLLSIAGGAALVMSACTLGPVDEPTRDRNDPRGFDQEPIVIEGEQEVLPWEEEDWNDWEEPTYGDNLNLSDVILETVLGPVGVIAGDTLRVDSYHEAYGDGYSYTHVQTTAPDVADGAAMVLLYVEGGLNHPMLVPGTRYSFSQMDGSIDGLNIDAVGCSGPDDGNWSDFDAPADEVDIEVEEGEEPGTQVLSYRATFFDYDGNKMLAEGSFAYNPSDI